ncbi:hypothetical protein RCG19_18775 [Neobacillus sp. OS1-2]|uniref:hypothetical protein n=1 Tax=Neobacillus sp. OS1-2 TaxID=3070680 RepID=UPI0027DFFBC8|nr:hypothetical protein [Neobacillus sp. OS1-2]WML39206.1 hypothetical protein RCG19_18775 [Neobacillus sp. OS1-2]
MNENFFADYKKFIVTPVNEKTNGNEVFDPKNYASHYILTLTIYNSRLSSWRDASKYEIDVEKSIKTVLKEFNQRQTGKYHLELLELDRFKNYFVLALSSKTKIETNEENDRIYFVVDRILTNPFYVGQRWFNLIGEKGRVERKLFCCSFMKYEKGMREHQKIDNKVENITELIPKNGEIKLIKTL